jgi:serine/threonine protein kinase
MITGEAPWRCLGLKGQFALFTHITTTKMSPLDEEKRASDRTMSPEFEAFLGRCFERNYDHRPYADALALDPFLASSAATEDDTLRGTTQGLEALLLAKTASHPSPAAEGAPTKSKNPFKKAVASVVNPEPQHPLPPPPPVVFFDGSPQSGMGESSDRVNVGSLSKVKSPEADIEEPPERPPTPTRQPSGGDDTSVSEDEDDDESDDVGDTEVARQGLGLIGIDEAYERGIIDATKYHQLMKNNIFEVDEETGAPARH